MQNHDAIESNVEIQEQGNSDGFEMRGKTESSFQLIESDLIKAKSNACHKQRNSDVNNELESSLDTINACEQRNNFHTNSVLQSQNEKVCVQPSNSLQATNINQDQTKSDNKDTAPFDKDEIEIKPENILLTKLNSDPIKEEVMLFGYENDSVLENVKDEIEDFTSSSCSCVSSPVKRKGQDLSETKVLPSAKKKCVKFTFS